MYKIYIRIILNVIENIFAKFTIERFKIIQRNKIYIRIIFNVIIKENIFTWI